MNDIVVDVQQVNKSFGNEQVLKNVSLQLEKGKIHGKCNKRCNRIWCCSCRPGSIRYSIHLKNKEVAAWMPTK